eukprot:CAMPEP_0206291036 /NCGR_PEP_ID=MMETSP0106_2-20121207/2921_1 /ASSEMBLY_ACC=CAM_ASM_000206 /TAXON_ID=81532 /ORGANISM="Acanthoeca-like sp., Strain 10tr" /LENGTH=469 /DNA_ID=CAMNT_0053721601 /DNA_START=3 /DNA_END=1412 /DNA_ORIENTATION=+
MATGASLLTGAVDASEQTFPEAIEDFLEDGIAVTSAFNRRGTMLAVGCNDGRLLIWDFDTRGVSRVMSGHTQTISAVSWSRNGRKVLSASADWHVMLWDVLNSERIISVKFDGPVFTATMHPRDDSQFLVCPIMSTPVLVRTKGKVDGEPARIPLPLADEECGGGAAAAAASSKSRADTFKGVFAIFSRRGERIYAGTPRGKIMIFETESLELVESVTVATGNQCGIKSIAFSRSGDAYVVNSQDRAIRVYRTEGNIIEHKFQDVVNLNHWKSAAFSHRGDYVIAGSAQEAQHHIYVWDREKGTLVRMLEGPKEGLLDVQWHPGRPVIASISTFGIVYIWAITATEHWSSFAPDFTELEENQEYIEREDEFDIVDETAAEAHSADAEEDEAVDILTVEHTTFASSDEEPLDDELIYLPTEPLLDHPSEDEGELERGTKRKGLATASATVPADSEGLGSKRSKKLKSSKR